LKARLAGGSDLGNHQNIHFCPARKKVIPLRVSVDASVRIPAGSSKALEAVSQYLARAPVSLQKLLVEEGGAGRVLYYTACNPYFRTNAKLFSATDFIAELLQQICAYCRSSVPPLFVPSRFMEYVLGMPVS